MGQEPAARSFSNWDESFPSNALALLKIDAARLFHARCLPCSREEWETWRRTLRRELWARLGTPPDHALPVDLQVLGSIPMKGYRVDRIIYQSRPGFYVTGNLYVPDGAGPFPAVLNVHGHWSQGRLAERVQARGHTLAVNGYVALAVDAFGSGERGEVHGKYNYHGSHLGASLFDVGETLMGMQIVDNMRAVDVLRSLDYVLPDKIGVTGASGGGNQTFWVAAMDERIAAAVPVVSVGTFEAYVGGSNCVCETLPGAVPLTEMAGIAALVAPRALKMVNALHDSNPTFFPVEMLRTFNAARPVFQALDADNRLANQIVNEPHGYWPVVRQIMLGWFDRWLKGEGDGSPRAEKPFETLSEEAVMCFKPGKRPARVQTITAFCRTRGSEVLAQAREGKRITTRAKRNDLRKLLCIDEALLAADVRELCDVEIEGRAWQRRVVMTVSGESFSVLLREPRNSASGWVIVPALHEGAATNDARLIERALRRGQGVLLFSAGRTGETPPDAPWHTKLARAYLWMGKTFLGERVRAIELMIELLGKRSGPISLAGSGLGAVAALLYAGAFGGVQRLELDSMPASYLAESLAIPFSIGIHIPNILTWGDLADVMALSEADITLTRPLHLDGTPMSKARIAALRQEAAQFRKKCGLKRGKVSPAQ